ncbi:MAG: NADPH-dependent FMN reductase [Bacteroidota bacterium]
MNIIAFGTSTKKKSINQQFAEHVAQLFQGAEVCTLRLSDYECALYSEDRETEGIPSVVIDFMEKLTSADLVVLSLAEHNGSYTAAFKNLFDWCSRYQQKTFENIRFFLLSTSPGPRGGMGVMNAALERFPRHQAIILDHFSLPNFQHNFRPNEGITDEALCLSLHEKIQYIQQSLTT